MSEIESSSSWWIGCLKASGTWNPFFLPLNSHIALRRESEPVSFIPPARDVTNVNICSTVCLILKTEGNGIILRNVLWRESMYMWNCDAIIIGSSLQDLRLGVLRSQVNPSFRDILAEGDRDFGKRRLPPREMPLAREKTARRSYSNTNSQTVNRNLVGNNLDSPATLHSRKQWLPKVLPHTVTQTHKNW